jgi:hypothetical protein
MSLLDDFEGCSGLEKRSKVLLMTEYISKRISLCDTKCVKLALENEAISNRGGLCVEPDRPCFTAALVLAHRKIGRTLVLCRTKEESLLWTSKFMALANHIQVTDCILKTGQVGVTICHLNRVIPICDRFDQYDRVVLNQFDTFPNVDFIYKIGGKKTLKWGLSSFPWLCKPKILRKVADWIGLVDISCEDVVTHFTIGTRIEAKDGIWEHVFVECTTMVKDRCQCSASFDKIDAITKVLTTTQNVVIVSQFPRTIATLKKHIKIVDKNVQIVTINNFLSGSADKTETLILIEPQLSINTEDMCRTLAGCTCVKLILKGSVEEQIVQLQSKFGWSLRKAFDTELLMLNLLKTVI